MTENELIAKVNELVVACLEAGGDPATIADELREIADEVCEEG
jgi:hypothetical protein